ncbi:MAG: tyrosine-type recombinase/integrase [Halomonas sp.]|uniref:tyrosine-type recombinase/integrase n=1 Tax=Halomonas sp. TaxID=1486246 RepID=UPI002ACEDAA7|nr:tyrosine-type recombinase/integrase [Halomonas sp.]MDZ7852363.1 tyrosine-type recombinase/integrase [Halomonas sp.]
MPSCPPYLICSRHGIYYFRLVVPAHLRSTVGRTEIRQSLRTRSKREALLSSARLFLESQSLLGRCTPPANIAPSSLLDITPQSSPCLTSLLEEYSQLQKRSAISQKTIDDKAALVRLLAKVVGDVPISSVGAKEAREFRDIALQLPPLAARKLSKHPELKISDFVYLVDEEKAISITTYNNYVKNLSAFFNFAIEQGYIDNNPFKNMRIKQNVKSNAWRDVFSSDDINAILISTANEKGYKYWLPRLALYTGARLNELCQLYKNDIILVDGMWCIHINEKRSDQKLKSLHSERMIPVHSKLLEMGIIDVVKEGRLFPELSYHDKHGYSGQPSKWFSRVRNSLEIQGEKRKDFHSFRHTVANQLKQKGHAESLIAGLLGHATGGITNTRYGKDYAPEVLVNVVEEIAYSSS